MKRIIKIFLFLLTATLAEAGDPADFNGHYVWSGRTNESAAVECEVTAAVKTLNFFLRPIARPLLARSIAPYETFDLTVSASNTLVFTHAGEPPMTCALNGGAAKRASEEGTSENVTFAMTPDGKLQQTFSEEDGARVNLFSLTSGGTNLSMDVTVNSKRLGHVINYHLTYQKQPISLSPAN